MNYSDYDSDGYSSNDDVDYVPSADNLSEDDMNECVKEDPLGDNDTVPLAGGGDKKSKTKAKKLTKRKEDGGLGMRKRKKGILKVDEDKEEKEEGENDEGSGANEKKEEEEEEEPVEKVGRSDDLKQKRKADDLWASFLSDVGTRPQQSPTPAESGNTEEAQDLSPSDPSVSMATKTPEPAKPAASQSTVTITKVFDFAGEEVRVTKQVSADSREARGFLKSQEQEQQMSSPASRPSPGGLPGPSSGKRPVGMSSILGHIGGKKQKMSTLEKSKMDWDCFKTEEGITEELAIHNRGKEGYVERKNFLERVDHRQFEREKEIRLTNMKR